MINSIAGARTGRSQQPRTVIRDSNLLRYESGVIDSSCSYNGKRTNFTYEFEAGTLMGRRTDNQKWVPLKLTRASGAGSSATSLIVDDSTFFKVGDTIAFASETGVEITAIDYSTDTLTIASSTWSDNDYVIADGDLAGAGKPIGILCEFVNLEDLQLKTVQDGEVWNILVFGFPLDDMLLGDVASMKAYIAANGGMKGIHFESEIL